MKTNPYVTVLQRTMAKESYSRLHGIGLVDGKYVASQGQVLVRIPKRYIPESLEVMDNYPDISRLWPTTSIVWKGEIPLEYIKATRVKYQLTWVFSRGGVFAWDKEAWAYVKVRDMPAFHVASDYEVGINLYLLKQVISAKTKAIVVNVHASKEEFSEVQNKRIYYTLCATFTTDDGMDGLIMPLTLKESKYVTSNIHP